MKIVKTHHVDSHHTNPLYECILIIWDKMDFNFKLRYKADHLADWMPKDDEIFLIIENLLKTSPTFRGEFNAKYRSSQSKLDSKL